MGSILELNDYLISLHNKNLAARGILHGLHGGQEQERIFNREKERN
jgi:hypothetical protein